jgi:hypothetical protein
MARKTGISLLSSNNLNIEIPMQGLQLDSLIQAARVKSIVLDENHPRFVELGEWNALGVIEFEYVNNPVDSQTYPVAFPFNSNTKNYPLINEIVYLLSLPDTSISDFTSGAKSYYIDVVSIWNHPHHNAYPTQPGELPNSQQKDYTETQAGSVRRVTDQSTEINLGSTFVERSNIHPLLPFEGDRIIEGRWGNSLRLGSTVFGLNNWSTTGESGDPITVLRNGQGEQTEEGWIPVTENINNDDSSIYLTSTQQIPLEVSNESYKSYTSPPENLGKYQGKQIILNSGRLVFSSNDDHILFNTPNSFGVTANSFNIDSSKSIIQSNEIYLGSKDATEPLLKGDTTIDLISQLIDQLINLNIALKSVTPTGGPAVAPAAITLEPFLRKLKTQFQTLTKSKISKTL